MTVFIYRLAGQKTKHQFFFSTHYHVTTECKKLAGMASAHS